MTGSSNASSMRVRTLLDLIDVQWIINATVREHVPVLDGAWAPVKIVPISAISVASTRLRTSWVLTDAHGTTNVQVREPVLLPDGALERATASRLRLQSTRNALLTKPKTNWDQTNAAMTNNAMEQDTAP